MSAPCPMLGFTVWMTIAPAASLVDMDALWDSFIGLLEANGLETGGGGDREQEYVVHRSGGQATDADRELVAAWATEWSSVAHVRMSDIVDLSDVD